METNSTELEKAIQRIPPTPGFFICHCDSRAPMSGHSDDLRATIDYLMSYEPELIQVVTAGGLTLSLRFPP